MSAKRQKSRRVLLFSHMVPLEEPDNAGQRLVAEQALHWLGRGMGVDTLTVASRKTRHEAALAVTPCHFLNAPQPNQLTRITRFLSKHISPRIPGTPVPSIAHALCTDASAKRRIGRADTIVLHWQREAALAPIFKRINPQARIVAVLHDVDSQRALRKLQECTGTRSRLTARIQLAAARLTERLIIATSDVVIVLSDKDAELLPSRRKSNVTVVPPPMPVPESFVRAPKQSQVLFVGAPRPENEEALRWLLEPVGGLPEGASLRVVGKQRKPFKAYLDAAGVDSAGFVPDLDGEYAHAAVAVVPLRSGAGVKFKTLEAVLRKVPIVTTAIGAEGIVGLEGSDDVTDSPAAFENRLRSFLENPALAAANADRLFSRVVQAHGFPAFQEALDRVLD